MRTILASLACLAAAGGLPAFGQAPDIDRLIADAGCAPALFRDTIMTARVFPDIGRDTLLAICHTETPATMPDGRPYLAKREELRLFDRATLAPLASLGVGCCRARLVITLQDKPAATPPEGRGRPVPISDALKRDGVARSLNIHVTDDTRSSAHDFQLAGDVWQIQIWD